MWGKRNRQSGDDLATERGIDRRSLLRSIGAGGAAAGGLAGFANASRAGQSGAAPAFARDLTTQGLPNTVTIRADGRRTVQYEFTVSGTVERGPDTDSGDAVAGGAVAGAVAQSRTDSFRFSGRITTFALAGGPATISVNGQAVDDPVGRPRSGGQDAPAQPSNCLPVNLLRSSQPVTDFYGYVPDADEPDSQRSNTGLEGDGVSRILLYQGPGGLSVVMFHGGGPNDQGGAATFEVTGLPSGGEWVVLDDDYEGATDEFEISETSAVLNWAWGVEGRSDGAVFRGLGDSFEIRIDPTFNEDARLDPFGPGEIEHWELLSADGGGNFTAYRLPLDEPLVLSSEPC